MRHHTKGPWVVKGTLFGEWHISSEYGVNGEKLANGRQHIANSPSASSKLNPAYFDMFMANARLIAAAPELLEALEDLKREIILSDVDMAYIDSHFKPWIEKARAAIDKATA